MTYTLPSFALFWYQQIAISVIFHSCCVTWLFARPLAPALTKECQGKVPTTLFGLPQWRQLQHDLFKHQYMSVSGKTAKRNTTNVEQWANKITMHDVFIRFFFSSWAQTNQECRAKIHQAIGPREDLLTTVKGRKLQWYGHGSRSSGLAKTILQGTVKGGRRQGREKKRWEDNIREWTGLEFAKSQRQWRTERGKKGGNWLGNHLWCPNDPYG